MKNKKYKLISGLLILILTITSFGFSVLPQSDSVGDEDVTVNITQIDTTAFPTVTLYVSVLDSNGEPYGIDPGRLIIEENGQQITSDRIEGFGGVGALTTMLVMDISGSMNTAGKLEAAKRVAVDYVNQMRPGDQAGIIVFNTEIGYIQPITKSKEDLITAINGITAQSDTAMYDAIFEAVMILESVSGRKAVIALTDGLDNQSVYTTDDIIENIGPSGLSISTIGLGEPGQGSGAQTALDEVALQDLASMAGGRYGYAEDEDQLAKIYDLYGRSLQSEYVISYLSPSDLRDGVNRKINVRLSSDANLSGSGFAESEYNPGGLVPEVSNPAPWSVFGAIVGALILLFIIPIIIMNTQSANKSGMARSSKRQPKGKSRIKLK